MDADTARTIMIIIAAVLALAWLFAARAMAVATRERNARARDVATRFDIEETAAPGTYLGEMEVEGSPEELSGKLAASLSRNVLGPVKILSCDPREVSFASALPTPNNPFKGGRFRLSPSGRGTRVEYAVDGSSGTALLAVGWVFVALGFLALVGGCWLMLAVVIPSPNPQIRGQAVQMFQACHFIWPPFLFAFLTRRLDRSIRAGVESLVSNLPYA